MVGACILVILLMATFWLVGQALLFLLFRKATGPFESDMQFAYALCLGLAAYSAMLFVLCLVKGYGPAGALVGTAVLLFGAIAILRGQLVTLVKAGVSGVTRMGAAAGLMIFTLSLPGFLLSLLPPFYKDTLIYHLYIPKLMLETGTFVHIPGLSNTNFPLGMELIFGIGLMVNRPEVCRILHFAFFGALLLATWRIGNRFHKWGGTVAAVITALTPSMLIVATWGYLDIALAFVVLTALAAIADPKIIRSPSGIALIGLLVGFSLWMKFLSLYFAGYSMAILLIAFSHQKADSKSALFKVLGAGGIAGIFALPWYLKNIIETGNPVYPYFTSLFGGAQQWNDVLDKAHFYLLSSYGYGEGAAKYLLTPWYMVRHAKFESIVFDGVIGWVYLPLFALLAFGLFRYSKQRTEVRIFGLAFLFGYFLWLTNSQQMRFLLPSIALLPLIGVGVTTSIKRFPKLQEVLFAGLAILALGGLVSILPYYKSIDPSPYLMGKENRHEFLMRTDPLHKVYTYMNQNLTPDDRAFLILVGNKRFYLDIPAYSDSIFENYTIQKVIRETKSAKGLLAYMREQKFTHVLFDVSYIKKPLEPDDLLILKEFFEKFTTLEFQDKSFALVRITPEG